MNPTIDDDSLPTVGTERNGLILIALEPEVQVQPVRNLIGAPAHIDHISGLNGYRMFGCGTEIPGLLDCSLIASFSVERNKKLSRNQGYGTKDRQKQQPRYSKHRRPPMWVAIGIGVTRFLLHKHHVAIVRY